MRAVIGHWRDIRMFGYASLPLAGPGGRSVRRSDMSVRHGKMYP